MGIPYTKLGMKIAIDDGQRWLTNGDKGFWQWILTMDTGCLHQIIVTRYMIHGWEWLTLDKYASWIFTINLWFTIDIYRFGFGATYKPLGSNLGDWWHDPSPLLSIHQPSLHNGWFTIISSRKITDILKKKHGSYHIVFFLAINIGNIHWPPTSTDHWYHWWPAKVESRHQTHSQGFGPHVHRIGLVLLAALVLPQGRFEATKRNTSPEWWALLRGIIPQMSFWGQWMIVVYPEL